MYDKVLTLVSRIKSIDDYGDTVTLDHERDVFCDEISISHNEFYQAQANGFKAEIKFILPDYLEYQNEDIVKYTRFGEEEEEYTVIRTYRNNNELELVCKRGVNDE